MNSISISGNLGKDGEVEYTPGGDPVLKFSVADSQGRDKPTIWWNCSLFGKRAESLAPYLLKGQTVTVIGSISEREYEGRDGVKKKFQEVRVNDVALQGGKKEQGKQEAPRQQGRGGDVESHSYREDIPFANPYRGRYSLIA